MNPLLYGHNSEERVVAIQQLGDSTIRKYKRAPEKARPHSSPGNSAISYEDTELFPFFFLSDALLLDRFSSFHWLKALDGNHHYKFLAVFRRWSEMWEAVQFVLKEHNKTRGSHLSNYQELDTLLLRPDPAYQYLIQSGTTLFKGMSFEDLLRLQVDIQVYSNDRSPDNSQKKQSRVLVISLADNRGWSLQIDGQKLDEVQMLKTMTDIVRDRDPDVIEGHELLGSSLPYLMRRSEIHSVDLAWGRDGSSLKRFQKRLYSDDEFTSFECAGRHLVDTMHLARAYDFTKRSLESYELSNIAAHFGLHKSILIPRSKVVTTWDAEPANVMQHSMENVDVVRDLSGRLSPSNFCLTQMCPFNYGSLTQLGSAARLESLIVREYLRQKHSIPKPQQGSQSVGGYTEIFLTGVLNNVLNADIESLYPSIMISNEIRPGSDTLGVFTPLLGELTALRLKVKVGMKTGTTSPLSADDALQSALKVLINSFYGYLAYSRGLFNDVQQADVVTVRGQEILRSIIRQIILFNGEPIEVDTDGIFFVPPDNVAGDKKEEAFIQKVSDTLPDGINLVLAGRYKKMLSYKKKNYALLDDSNTLIIRGSSLMSRSIERFARRFIQRCIGCLLTEDIAGLHHTFASYYTRIKNHEWESVDFCRTETVREDLDRYVELLNAGKRNPSPPYEAARNAGVYFKSGERVSYYVTGAHADVKITEHCRIAEEWDPNLPDENTAYYLVRLQECSNKFREFFEPPDFERIFSLEDLFGFSPEGMRVITRKTVHEEEGEEGKGLDESEEFGIWLGER